jgi:multidrug efflux system outer membrane protein
MTRTNAKRLAAGSTRLPAILLAVLLAACTSAPPTQTPTPALPTAWRGAPATLPHGGRVAELSRWWQAFDDPQLLMLIARAQARSPSLGAVAARRRAAQAQADQARALLWPQLQAQAQAARARSAESGFQSSTQGRGALAASWEVDLFGAQRAQAEAGQALAEAAAAQWHEARVSLAADVASAYLQLRHAQAQEELGALDQRLAEQSAAWGREQQRAGLAQRQPGRACSTPSGRRPAPPTACAAPRPKSRCRPWPCCAPNRPRRSPNCSPRRALPTGFEFPQRRLPAAPALRLDSLPARLLAQRPDLHAAHQQWLAAVHAARAADAQAYPQLSLSGLIGRAELRLGGSGSSGAIGSGAALLSLPLFDGGLRERQREAASAEADAAAALLQQRWLRAVAEVEQALQRVRAGAERQTEVDASKREWEAIARRSLAQSQAGLQSGPQRNDTLRTALAAYAGVLAVRHEHSQSWIDLYRALGGGWSLEQAGNS